MRNQSGIKLVVTLLVIAAALVLSIQPLVKNTNLGLDLQGGAEVVLQAVPDDGTTVTAEDMQQLVTVMNNRVNELGVSEPIIQVEGNDRLIVELAGVDNPEKAIEIIGKTAQLEFRDPNGNVLLTGADLEDASAVIDNSETSDKMNQVSLTFNSEGAKKFFDATSRFVGQIIYIYLDDEVISSPMVNEPIPSGQASISGGFKTYEEAANLAALLRGGSLPFNIDVLSKNTVGPTLGADSLSASLQAALLGFILLFAFMILYYRLPGCWACVSLVVYALILLWVLNLLNATLTLTSIAGFILSAGMAVDSNIIIYERIREELRKGKSLKAGIESGFKRAFTTILDSNLTTLIASIVLYYFGTGTVKGFALTLSIGLIASLFTAITFTKAMLRWMSDVDFLSDKRLYAGNLQ
ncbi:MAG: protein translocase subunit SecD [Firmicutes bacterium]|nr:protein translocase subunit SecD [Bacillota bacterium]